MAFEWAYLLFMGSYRPTEGASTLGFRYFRIDCILAHVKVSKKCHFVQSGARAIEVVEKI